jgi:serine/threonine protein kinase/Flp pilus assembly protein TadD
MGIVYRAVEPESSTEVAIKVLLRPDTAAPTARARFRREITAMLALNHPHVVRLLDAGEHKQRPYLVMELVEGESLQERISKHGPLDSGLVAQIGVKLAGALSAIHAVGIIHRDVKPENVILAAEDEPRLTDFGLAKDLDSESHLSKTGQFMGTPGYWPPEQASGKLDRIGPSSDVYSLGATLYALLTGVAPLLAGSLLECMAITCGKPAEAPSVANAAVPAELDRIVLKCLEKQTEDRYPDAAALRRELEGFLAADRGGPLGSRSRAPLFAALALGVLAVGVAAVSRRDRETPPPQPPPPVIVGKEDSGPDPSASPAPRTPALDSLDALIATASSHLERDDPALALAAYHEFIRLDPTNPRGYLDRGALYSALELAGRARDDFKKALVLGVPAATRRREVRALFEDEEAKAPRAKVRGNARRDRANGVLVRDGAPSGLPPDQAIERCEAAIAVDPTWTGGYHERGWAHYRKGEYRLALLDSERTLALDDSRGGAYYNRGLAFLALKENERALDALNGAVETLGGHPGRYLRLRGRILGLLGRFDEALADYQAAFKILTAQSPAYEDPLRREIIAVEKGMFSQGSKPKTASECLARGIELRERRAWGIALAVLTEALRLEPTAEIYSQRGRCYAEAGRASEAIADVDRATKLGLSNAFVWATRGRALAGLGKDAAAIDAYTKALTTSPNDHESLSLRARARVNTGGFTDALRDFNRAYKLAPEAQHAQILYERGRCHAQAGALDMAFTDLDRAVGLRPRDPDTHQWRGLFRARLGDRAGAKGDLQRALELLSVNDPRRAQIQGHLRQLN